MRESVDFCAVLAWAEKELEKRDLEQYNSRLKGRATSFK